MVLSLRSSSTSLVLIQNKFNQHWIRSTFPFNSSRLSNGHRRRLHHTRFAIVGAGPAGFYSAYRIISRLDSSSSHSNFSLDLFESLPTPYGLSRYGVAPDHPEVKNCEHKFAQVALDRRFRYFGNVKLVDEHDLSKDNQEDNHQAYVTLSSLREDYDVVLLAYGAGRDRSLGGLPGENELLNILPARKMVHWYNGYPSSSTAQPTQFADLSKLEHVTIIGQGNVALDLARILLTDIDVLAKTDISQQALQQLAQSRVRHVEIVGRRGPLQAAMTTKELRELVGLKDVEVRIEQDVLSDAIRRLSEPNTIARLSNARMVKRRLELMHQASRQNSKPCGTGTGSSRTCTFTFLRTPLGFDSTTDDHRVGSVRWRLNMLAYPASSDHHLDLSAIPAVPIKPEIQTTTATDLVLKSLGYRPVTLRSVPFDEGESRVRNRDGRVLGRDGQPISGLYVSGWLSRGPKGVIGDTMSEAFRTADAILDDLLVPDRTPVAGQLAGNEKVNPSHHHDFQPRLINSKFRIDWQMWTRVDLVERARGASKSKPREKILSVKEILQVAGIL